MMAHHMVLAGSVASNTEVVTWWVLAIVAVGAALGMILTRRAVHCAILLAVVMLILAGMYAMQGAPFLAFVQVIVYTGAVLMLFLFVMMIVGITAADSIVETIRGQRLFAGLAGIAMLVLLILVVGHATIGAAAPSGPRNSSSNVQGLAKLVFTSYVFPFEVTSALLITAALGAMVLAHRERTTPKPSQRDLAARRLASGHLAPDPSPGVYALHDSADRPALLPDGSTSEASVSATLSPRDPNEEPSFVRPEDAVPVTAASDEQGERQAIAGRADS
jgi:NADH-quinone oxidoreductase subunit J